MIPQLGDTYLAGDVLKEIMHVSETTFNATNIVLRHNPTGWFYLLDYTLYFDVPEHWHLVGQGKPMDAEKIKQLVKEYLVCHVKKHSTSWSVTCASRAAVPCAMESAATVGTMAPSAP